MIDKVLERINEAEKKADEKKERARIKADEIRSSADRRAAEIAESAKKNAKAEKNNVLLAAEMKAKEDYARRIGEAKNKGNELKLSSDKAAEELAVKIANDIKAEA